MNPLQQLAHSTALLLFKSTPQRQNMIEEIAEMEAVILEALEEARKLAHDEYLKQSL